MNNKKVSNYLKNVALRYLSRYSVSSSYLEKHLLKKIKKRYQEELQDNPDYIYNFQDLIKETIFYLKNLGYLDDETYANFKTKSLIRKGKSFIHLNLKLQEKGLSRESITNALGDIDIEKLETFGALKYIKKKSLGCFRKNPNYDRQKEFNSLARQGFSIRIISKVLSFTQEDITTVDNLYYTLEKELNL